MQPMHRIYKKEPFGFVEIGVTPDFAMKLSFVAAAVAAVHALPTTHGSEIHPSVAKR